MKRILLYMYLGSCVTLFSQSLDQTGSLNTARRHHQSVTLNNGKVLTMGGDSGGATNYFSSAELFDPTTEMWTPVASMAVARNNFGAELLSNGKVLVVGGRDAATYGLTSCEIFDPVTNTWSAAADLTYGRWGHKVVKLQDGKILAVGGDDYYRGEIYDVSTNTWSPTAQMQYDHGQYSSLVVLSDGKVLCTGGWFSSPDGFIAEVYDPVNDTWTAVGNMNKERNSHASVLLDNGKVLVYGGVGTVFETELFDPNTNTFTLTGNLNQLRAHSDGIKLANGNVFTYGNGTFFSPGNTGCIEIYNPSTGVWTAPVMATTGHQLYQLEVVNDKLLIIGGSTTTKCYYVDGLTVGVSEEVNSEVNFELYPNPVSNVLNIKLTSAEQNATRIEVVNVLGKIISINKLEKSLTSIDVSSIDNGVYIVNVYKNNERVSTKKIIKN